MQGLKIYSSKHEETNYRIDDKLKELVNKPANNPEFNNETLLYELYKEYDKEYDIEIMLYKSAKDVFKKYRGKKLPKVKELSDEFGRILSEKRKLYEEYKTAKKEMMDYQIAKSNVDKVKRYQPDKFCVLFRHKVEVVHRYTLYMFVV